MTTKTQRPATELKLTDISRRFGQRTVFSGISAEAFVGRSVVVAGPNGSGKTTLLKIIAGLLSPTTGDVNLTVDGNAVDNDSRRGMLGYVSPDLVLYRELSGVENLQFFAQVAGFEPTTEYLRELLTFVGLKGRGREFVGNYSSGMRQRLKFAFALLRRPPVLLLDEPTANLDSAGVEMVRAVVKDQKKRGILVIATNEPQEVAWGDTVVQLG